VGAEVLQHETLPLTFPARLHHLPYPRPRVVVGRIPCVRLFREYRAGVLGEHPARGADKFLDALRYPARHHACDRYAGQGVDEECVVECERGARGLEGDELAAGEREGGRVAFGEGWWAESRWWCQDGMIGLIVMLFGDAYTCCNSNC
jgi:hypothetical protein